MEEVKGDDALILECPKKRVKLSSKQNRKQQREAYLIDEIHRLYNDEGCSANHISHKLKVEYRRVLKIINDNIRDPAVAFHRLKKHQPFE
jgi:hypothetical protein